MGEGRNQEACARFEESQVADSGIGTRMYLAECYRRIDRLASAWATFREAASVARAEGQPSRAAIAEENAKSLQPRLSRLTLVPPTPRPEGFELLLDGSVLSPLVYGRGFPIDGGPHVISMRAPGYQPASLTVEIPSERAREVTRLPSLPPTVARAAPPPASDPATERSSAIDRRLWGLALGGAGALSLGIGLLYGIRASSLDAEAQDECTSRNCSDDAISASKVANVAYLLGGIAGGLGAWLYFGAPDSDAASAARTWHVGWSPSVSRRAQGLVVEGAF